MVLTARAYSGYEPSDHSGYYRYSSPMANGFCGMVLYYPALSRNSWSVISGNSGL